MKDSFLEQPTAGPKGKGKIGLLGKPSQKKQIKVCSGPSGLDVVQISGLRAPKLGHGMRCRRTRGEREGRIHDTAIWATGGQRTRGNLNCQRCDSARLPSELILRSAIVRANIPP